MKFLILSNKAVLYNQRLGVLLNWIYFFFCLLMLETYCSFFSFFFLHFSLSFLFLFLPWTSGWQSMKALRREKSILETHILENYRERQINKTVTINERKIECWKPQTYLTISDSSDGSENNQQTPQSHKRVSPLDVKPSGSCFLIYYLTVWHLC